MSTSELFALNELFPELTGDSSASTIRINDLVDDSRKVIEGSAFCAIKGHDKNGELFIPQAIKAGAKLIIKESRAGVIKLHESHLSESVFDLEVPALKARLPLLAERFNRQPSSELNLVGITGTNGKTTIAFLLGEIWQGLAYAHSTIGTLGIKQADGTYSETGLTTPGNLVLQKALRDMSDNNVAHVALEVSSHGIAQGRVDAMVFKARVFSNLSRDHLDYHETMDAYAQTKLDFLRRDLDHPVIVNIDDEYGRGFLNYNRSLNVISYSIDNTDADIYLNDVKALSDGFSAELVSRWGRGRFSCALLGRFNLHNLLAAVACVLSMGDDFDKVLACLSFLKSAPGRLQLLKTKSSLMPKIYVDYAHTPDALEKVICSLRPHVSGRLCVVFGCGGDRDKGKRAQMGGIVNALADCVVVTTDNPRKENPDAIIDEIFDGIEIDKCESVLRIVDRSEAIAKAVELMNADDCILLAGKGHEDYQIIGSEKIPYSDFDVVKKLDETLNETQDETMDDNMNEGAL